MVSMRPRGYPATEPPKPLPKVDTRPALGADGRISTTFAGQSLRVTQTQGEQLLFLLDRAGHYVPPELRSLFPQS